MLDGEHARRDPRFMTGDTSYPRRAPEIVDERLIVLVVVCGPSRLFLEDTTSTSLATLVWIGAAEVDSWLEERPRQRLCSEKKKSSGLFERGEDWGRWAGDRARLGEVIVMVFASVLASDELVTTGGLSVILKFFNENKAMVRGG